MKKENTIPFKLTNVETLQFATIKTEIKDEGEIKIKADYGFGINNEIQQILCKTKFEFQFKTKTFIIIEVSCEFQVDTKTWKTYSTKNEIELPKGLLLHLAMITVGTVRGVLHAKTENTSFNKFFLPALDITPMVTENLKFDFKE
jgi:hypothetical protein